MIPFAAAHIVGTLEAFDVVTRGQRGFQVANLRIRVGLPKDDPNDVYRRVTMEATHEARHMAEAIPLGSIVIVHGNVEAREWQGKWFLSIRVETIAKVEVVEREQRAGNAAPRRQEQPKDQQAQMEIPVTGKGGEAVPKDDVPF